MSIKESTYFVGLPNERVVSTPLFDNISNEMLLSIVCGQNGDVLRWVSNHPHVHKGGHHILSFSEILEREISNSITS